MSNLKEYVVSLKRREDLEDFYNDMETTGGSLYIPHRQVECSQKRPASRNTNYLLNPAEAEQIRNDPRVHDIGLSPDEQGLKITPFYNQTSTKWDKGSIKNVNTHRNWGLLRCVTGRQISNWGDYTETGLGTSAQSGTIQITSSGKNVDVVIIDGHMDPSHPEFAVNPDGTGGSRVNQYNWSALNPFVTNGAAGVGDYVYTPYIDANYEDTNPADGISDRTGDNDHGAHVTGTSCGNTQGWARDARIYNISPYGTNPNYFPFGATVFDYVRVFHEQKPINPETGMKDPTICNNSWGYTSSGLLSNITYINYRGTLYTGPFTSAVARSYGIVAYDSGGVGKYIISAVAQGMDVEVEDCINAGVICVGAAGNNYGFIDDPRGDDFDNYVIRASIPSPLYYCRGSSPGRDSKMICVGAVGANVGEYKAAFSNTGPRIDVFAPGVNIMSSVNSSLHNGTYDYRLATAYITKYNGTSMASPQVTGVLACMLETYPYYNQDQALAYIHNYSTYNQMSDGGSNRQTILYPEIDASSLQGATNRYLSYYKERNSDGAVYPKVNTSLRPTDGQVFPRPRIYRYGQLAAV
jgi:hypothetical protein